MDRATGSRLDNIFGERVSHIAEQELAWRAKLSELTARKHPVPRAYARRPPTAVCMSCGHFGYRKKTVGTLCTKRAENRRCGGFVVRAQALGKWQPCPSCLHAGFKKGISCIDCGGERWLFLGA